MASVWKIRPEVNSHNFMDGILPREDKQTIVSWVPIMYK